MLGVAETATTEPGTVIAIAAAISAIVAALIGSLSAMWVARRRGILDTEIAERGATAQVDAANASAAGQRDAATTSAEVQRELRDEERRVEFEATVARFRGPLLHAAFDLQSRLWNILRNSFIDSYYRNGTPRQQTYVVENTLFVIAQYFCWIEIIRREVQFVDIGDETAALSKLRNRIYYLWQTSNGMPDGFMAWAGEQRAIGELMIIERPNGPDCIGYAEFLAAREQGRLSLLDPLAADIERLPDDPDHGKVRLEAVQAELINLLALLDPDYTFFAEGHRTLARKP